MAREYRTHAWYVRNNLTPPPNVKPKAKGFTRKTARWYVERGLPVPENVKPLKVSISNVFKGAFHSPVQAELKAEASPAAIQAAVSTETMEQAETRINTRFNTLAKLSRLLIGGTIETLIVSGPPGLGKSFTVENELRKHDPNGDTWRVSKGYAKATGLYKLLWEFRHPGNILVFDDCDSIFEDMIALNLLKGATDTSKRRQVCWLSEAVMIGEDGDNIPRNFEFEGSIFFITNLDFDYYIKRGHKLAPHLNALLSRAHYMPLMLRGTRDAVIRIKQVVRDTNMLADLTEQEKHDVINFVETHADNLWELSLRTVLKVAALRKGDDDWQITALTTQCKDR